METSYFENNMLHFFFCVFRCPFWIKSKSVNDAKLSLT